MDLKSFFESEGIFYTALLPMEKVHVVNKPLLDRTIPHAQSALLFLVPYYVGNIPGNISLYARSKDYHLFAKELSGRLYAKLKKLYPERFLERTNCSLSCENCREKLCSHKTSLKRFLSKVRAHMHKN